MWIFIDMQLPSLADIFHMSYITILFRPLRLAVYSAESAAPENSAELVYCRFMHASPQLKVTFILST